MLGAQRNHVLLIQEPLGRWIDPQSPISQPSAYPEATPPQGSINVLYSPLRWHRSAGRKDERASASIPSLPHPPAEPQRLLLGSGLGGHGHSQGRHLPYSSTFHHPASARPVGSFQVEPWLQPFGMSHPCDPQCLHQPDPNRGDTSSSPTHFNSLVGWLEPLVPDTLKLVGGTMTSRVCPCAGGSSLARRGLPGSGRRGGWCFGTTWDHNGHRERQNP